MSSLELLQQAGQEEIIQSMLTLPNEPKQVEKIYTVLIIYRSLSTYRECPFAFAGVFPSKGVAVCCHLQLK